MRIILVRHTSCDVPPGRCYGRLDADLSADGHAALPALAATLRSSGFTQVISSPARRCRRLADLIGAPTLDPRLQELAFGSWEGRPWDELPRDALDAWAADPLGFAPPGGESGAALVARVRGACESLLEAGEDCVVVSHGGPLRLMPALLHGGTPDLLAQPPPLGGIVHVHVRAVSAAHSAQTSQPPSTSPVKPPI